MSLVREEEVPRFLADIKKAYYDPIIAEGRVAEADMPNTLFASKPSAGAAVMKLKLAPVEVEEKVLAHA